MVCLGEHVERRAVRQQLCATLVRHQPEGGASRGGPSRARHAGSDVFAWYAGTPLLHPQLWVWALPGV